jgi:myo-inositol-1(or 4)-monophosphatase
MRGSARDTVTSKSDERDVVTAADNAAEQLIVSRLRNLRSGDAVIAEESFAAEVDTAGVAWVIDPLDGTANYLSGAGPFSVSIGVRANGLPVVGAVYVPEQNQMYWAESGVGAYRNGHVLSAAKATRLAGAIVGVDGASAAAIRERQGRLIVRLLPKVRDMRRIGCCSVAMAWVAEGRLDGFFCHGAGPWDVVAGSVIAREAGAWAGSESGIEGPAENIVVAAPGLKEDLLLLAQQTK